VLQQRQIDGYVYIYMCIVFRDELGSNYLHLCNFTHTNTHTHTHTHTHKTPTPPHTDRTHTHTHTHTPYTHTHTPVIPDRLITGYHSTGKTSLQVQNIDFHFLTLL
jgi:hypothetical protein